MTTEVTLPDGRVVIVEECVSSTVLDKVLEHIKRHPFIAASAVVITVLAPVGVAQYARDSRDYALRNATVQTVSVPVPSPTLFVPQKAYGMVLEVGYNAYATPDGGDFLGYVNPGRGYAPLAMVGDWLYADVEGAGEVWLQAIPATAIEPTAVPIAPIVTAPNVVQSSPPVFVNKVGGEQTKVRP